MEAEKSHNLPSASREPGKLMVQSPRPENQGATGLSSGVWKPENHEP